MKTRTVGAVALAVCVALVGGCASPAMKRMEGDREEVREKTTVARDVQQVQAQERYPYWVERDEIYLGGRSVTPRSEDRYSELLELPAGFRRTYPVTLQVVAEYIAKRSNTRVTVTRDAVEAAREAAFDPSAALMRHQQQMDAGANGAVAQQQPVQGQNQDAGIIVDYSGTLRGLLDLLTARTNTSWKIDDSGIQIFHMDTRVYKISVLQGSKSTTTTISNTATGGGQGGGGGSAGGVSATMTSGNSTSVTSDIDLFTAAVEAITGMVSVNGRVAPSSGSTTVTVTDVPVVLDRIDRYVRELNDDLTQQLAVSVEVYSVELTEDERYGIDWQIVWESLSGRYRGLTESFGETGAQTNAFGIGVIDAAHNYAGSSVLLNALSQQGDVDTETTATFMTLSGQTVPVQVGEEFTFIESVQTNQVADAGIQTTRTLGSRTIGFSMNATPKVIANQEILFRLQITLNNLRELRQAGSGNELIEAPHTDTRQFLNEVKIRSGETLVLSGFEQQRLRTNARGIGSPKMTVAGGSRTGERRRTVLVILLTPRLV